MRSVLYLLIFLVTLHGTLIIYGNSSFLEEFLSSTQVSLVYMVSAVITITAIFSLRSFLRRIGAFSVTLATLCIELWALVGLASTHSPVTATLLFIVSQAAIGVLYVCFDIFLEHTSKNSNTGHIRGIFLTSINLAFLLGPTVAGFIIDRLSFSHVYAASALLLIPTILLSIPFLHSFKDNRYSEMNLLQSVRRMRKSKSISAGMSIYLLLWLFYVVAIVYVPLYLTQTLGFSYAETGTLLGIILIPFVLFQIPLGIIADKWLGEKEILIGGFSILCITSFAVPFVAPFGFWAIAAILFVSRIGACAVEVMADTYFFKHVADKDIDMITLYRSMMNMAYIITPIVVAPMLLLAGPASIFIVSGFFALVGLVPSVILKDTK